MIPREIEKQLPCENCIKFRLDEEKYPTCHKPKLSSPYEDRLDALQVWCPEDKAKLAIRLTLDELLHGCDKREPIWKDNKKCPNCGVPANPEIRACETGMSYCSSDCATEHVTDNTPPGGW